MKTCSKCRAQKPFEEFYKDKRSKDGFESCCKLCRLEINKKWRTEKPESYAAFQESYHDTYLEKKKIWRDKNRDYLLVSGAAYYHREKERLGARMREWRAQNPLNATAHKLTTRAIRSGELVPQPCEVCGTLKVEAHHDDYSKPLSVRWLCRPHHMQHHAQKARITKPNGENTEKI